MIVKGMLDRIVDGKQAVILAEEIGKEFVLELDRLPTGYKEGAWFDLIIQDNEIQTIIIDDEYTAEREKVIEGKMNRLRKRSSGSRFQRR